MFYDGHCGLCHRWVRFVLPRDPQGVFAFSPLQGEAIQQHLDEPTRTALPDSVVLLDTDGSLRCKSGAVLTIMRRLGGGWGALSAVLRIIPRFLRDLGYDAVARVRRKLFKPPEDACPLMPPQLRSRFLP